MVTNMRAIHGSDTSKQNGLGCVNQSDLANHKHLYSHLGIRGQIAVDDLLSWRLWVLALTLVYDNSQLAREGAVDRLGWQGFPESALDQLTRMKDSSGN